MMLAKGGGSVGIYYVGGRGQEGTDYDPYLGPA